MLMNVQVSLTPSYDKPAGQTLTPSDCRIGIRRIVLSVTSFRKAPSGWACDQS